LAARRVPRLDGLCRASLFFSAVRQRQAVLQVQHVHPYVRANEDRCIPRGSRLRDRGRWALVRRFRLPELRVRAVVPVAQLDGRGNATFRAA